MKFHYYLDKKENKKKEHQVRITVALRGVRMVGTIGYNVPIKRKFLREISFTLSGNNLYLWKNYNGFDPDVSTDASGSKIRRMDVGAYPKARKVVFSIQVRY